MPDLGAQQLFDLWKKQVEEGTQGWLKMLGQPPLPGQPAAVDPASFWRPVMDQAMAGWARVLSQGPASPELMTQWKQFLDQWIAAWSRVLEQAMGTDAFAKTLGKQMEGFLNAANPAKKAAEQQIEGSLAGLGLPSRTQVVSLAKQIVLLEEKIEGLEDKLDAILKRLEAR
jgi:polyhydroxyalkanoate synthesis regulator phasin